MNINTTHIHYIDVFKGICILFVVIHHVPFALNSTGCEVPIWGIIWLQNFIMGFFMPAFFIATGFCTNFNVPFHRFLWKNIKTIMLPCFFLYYFNHWLQDIHAYCYTNAEWLTWHHVFSPGVLTFIHYGGFYWFLTALFISKLLFYLVCHITQNHYTQIIITILLLLVGIYCNKNWAEYNYFYWQHALALLLFLPIGAFFRIKHEKIIDLGGYAFIIYLLLTTLFSFSAYSIPSLTRTFSVSFDTMLHYIVMALLGTFGIWWISERINECDLLEYWGHNTIVIYAFNYTTSCFVVAGLFLLIQPNSSFMSTIFFLMVVCIALVLLSGLSWLFTQRYVRWLLGRF